jgi:hypothetical protein
MFRNNLNRMEIEKLKYPIGLFQLPKKVTDELYESWINDLSTFPEKIKKELIGLPDEQLDTPYRPGGWTIRQVVHHCADSHMNSFTRFKLALTEEQPIIKPYFEERWAELTDSKKIPIAPSLKIIEGIHERWTALIRSLSEEEKTRTFIHPEHGKTFQLDEVIGFYAWHSNHHLAHITTMKKRNMWM